MPDQNHDTGRKPHPSPFDPLEMRIRSLIREQAFSSRLGRRMWFRTREIQKKFFNDALNHLDDSRYIHDRTQETLRQIAGVMNSKIVSGYENLVDVHIPAVIGLNHYSGYKLNSLRPEEVLSDFGTMKELYPFLSFFAALSPVARVLGEDVALYDFHLEYGQKSQNLALRKIQEEAGLLVIPEQSGGFSFLLDAARKFIIEKQRVLLVGFPEGESSGKRNNGGPYDLVPFHTGVFVIAAELGIPFLPAVQFFNPEVGFQVSVLPSIEPKVFERSSDGKLTKEAKDYYEKLAFETRQRMQIELKALTSLA
jgi:hypothetical protein